MNSVIKISKLPTLMVASRRGLQLSATKLSSVVKQKPVYGETTKLTPEELEKFDPNNYDIPTRPPTMDDLMEPYGSWKDAYEHERKAANKFLFWGIACFTFTCTVFHYSGTMDYLYMPNLDNLMEDTVQVDRSIRP